MWSDPRVLAGANFVAPLLSAPTPRAPTAPGLAPYSQLPAAAGDLLATARGRLPTKARTQLTRAAGDCYFPAHASSARLQANR